MDNPHSAPTISATAPPTACDGVSISGEVHWKKHGGGPSKSSMIPPWHVQKHFFRSQRFVMSPHLLRQGSAHEHVQVGLSYPGSGVLVPQIPTNMPILAAEATYLAGAMQIGEWLVSRQGGVYYSFSPLPETSQHSTYLIVCTTPIQRSFR